MFAILLVQQDTMEIHPLICVLLVILDVQPALTHQQTVQLVLPVDHLNLILTVLPKHVYQTHLVLLVLTHNHQHMSVQPVTYLVLLVQVMLIIVLDVQVHCTIYLMFVTQHAQQDIIIQVHLYV